MRVAVIHDWLYVVGGAELVLKEILACYPQADVFTLFDFLSPADRRKIGLGTTTTSFLQKLPFMKTHHRSFLPLMPIAIEQFDLSGYDLVISSSCAVAKGVLTGPDQVHVSYVHSPMRYAWDLQHSYLDQSGFKGLKAAAARYLLHRLRIWDSRTAAGPNVMLANSAFIARRIRKVYSREASVVCPPVTLSTRDPVTSRGNHFLAASRLVPYKNIEQIVRAFALLPDQQLIVAGDGPEAARLRAIAGPNVSFAGYVGNEELRRLMATARAFVFAAEEDFGIITVEAQSEGTPVLALGRGGSRETVIEGSTGLFFDEPTPQAIARCVSDFIEIEQGFSPHDCRRNASRFSARRFRREFTEAVQQAVRQGAKERGEVALPVAFAGLIGAGGL
ncbi:MULTISPECIES: glycosyltransferase [unclassified Rhizobium]|uniref:glycosyltransferase n=1 Tax=unclassified Rhizobium TaxID=2613769 RepID=UPI0006F6FC75|nr:MULTISPECIES: glycosyltransferase [unclassified Rhizobium]KQV33568.1 glycosyl transferase family 1 [Rhizobium sp. Root1212]KRD23112.1 glycosyl transferase family 1 [Rhizobium sp. Root268]